jgi:DNA-binding HxlR family transcriptional regulator
MVLLKDQISVDNLVFSCNHINKVRRRFDKENCSVAQALEVLGDWWTLLVVREAFFGTRRFADFARALGISKNVLTQRLEHLVRRGVLARVDAGQHGRRYEYVLSPMGKDLLMVVTALRQWGDRWIVGAGHEPLVVCERRTGQPIPRQLVRGSDGEPMRAGDFVLQPGPGASAVTRARFRRLVGAAPAAGDSDIDITKNGRPLTGLRGKARAKELARQKANLALPPTPRSTGRRSRPTSGEPPRGRGSASRRR